MEGRWFPLLDGISLQPAQGAVGRADFSPTGGKDHLAVLPSSEAGVPLLYGRGVPLAGRLAKRVDFSRLGQGLGLCLCSLFKSTKPWVLLGIRNCSPSKMSKLSILNANFLL